MVYGILNETLFQSIDIGPHHNNDAFFSNIVIRKEAYRVTVIYYNTTIFVI